MNSQTTLKIRSSHVWTILSAFVPPVLVSFTFTSVSIASPVDEHPANGDKLTQRSALLNSPKCWYYRLDTKALNDDTPDHYDCEWQFSTASAAIASSHGLIPTAEVSSGNIITATPNLEDLRRAIPQPLSSLSTGAIAQTTPPASDRSNESLDHSRTNSSDDIENNNSIERTVEQLDLDPTLVEESPVFQRWLEEIPDVASDIDRDPSFRTRLRLGYIDVWSADDGEGFVVGIEDVFLGQTGLTLSADYQSTFDNEHESFGAHLRYYILPLGRYINIAPQIGYRNLEVDGFDTDGPDLGIRVIAVLSRTGAADISISQRWINPGSDRHEVSLTTLTVGYAVTQRLRVSTEFQWQKIPDDSDRRLGLGLEWML